MPLDLPTRVLSASQRAPEKRIAYPLRTISRFLTSDASHPSHATFLAVGLAVALLSTGCRPDNRFIPPPPPEVTVAYPQARQVVDSTVFTGIAEPIELVEVRARVEGFLDSHAFDEGAEVSAGDPLFVIDPRPFEAALSQARASVALAEARLASSEAQLSNAKAQLANAEAQFERAQQAADSGAVTAAEMENRRTAILTARAMEESAIAAIASARAEIAAANAEVDKAELDLSYTQVTAPITGRVGRRYVDVGNLVGGAEKTLLTTIVRYDPIQAVFTISENDLLRFSRRQRLENPQGTKPLDRPVAIALGDEEGFPHPGRADFADLAIDQSTGTYLIRATVPNPNRIIPPGAFLRIQAPGEQIDALLIDETAIQKDQSGAYLLVVNAENVVEKRNVQLGPQFETLRAVSGPKVGPQDRVVVNGLQRARPGAKVAPVERTAEPLDLTTPE